MKKNLQTNNSTTGEGYAPWSAGYNNSQPELRMLGAGGSRPETSLNFPLAEANGNEFGAASSYF